MRNLVSTCTVALPALAALAACGSRPEAPPVPAGPPAMFRNGPAHTGVFAGPGAPALGAIAWRFQTDGPVRSSPTVAGDTVYAGSGDGRLYAIDRASGAERWRFDAGSPVDSSAAVAGDLVVFQSRDGAIRAVDRATGGPRWRVRTGPDLPWAWGHEGWDYFISSPAIVDDRVFVGAGDGRLYCLDLTTGQEAWRFQTGGRVRSSPAVAGDRVYVGSADGSLYAVDRASGAERWRFDAEGRTLTSAEFGYDRKTFQSSPALDAGTVYIGSRDGRMYAVDAATGTERWNVPSGPTWAISSPGVGNGVVVSGRSDQRYVHAVRAGSGEEIWRIQTGSVVFSSPAIAGDTIYIGVGVGDGTLLALDAATGATRWSYRTGAGIFSTPSVAGRAVYVGSDDGRIYAFEGGDGASPRRAVYWDEARAPRSLFPGHAEVRDYFGRAGYEVVDAAGLATFMEARLDDRAPSVVVFAIDDVPETVATSPSPDTLFRRYLDAGGKVVWLGYPPFVVGRDDQGRPVRLERGGPAGLVGVDHEKVYNMDVYRAAVTPDGERWGLAGWHVLSPGADPADVSVVLAADALGTAAAWVKSYGGPEGTGFVQLWPTARTDELAMFRDVAEYGVLRQ